MGWRPFIVHALNPADWQPKSRKDGCKASQAWNAVIMPTVIRATEALREGERLLVAEDSAWPTTACTPSNVQNLHGMRPRDVGRWLGGSRGCSAYDIDLGHDEQVAVNCFAPAGCKLCSGTAPFWRRRRASTQWPLLPRRAGSGVAMLAIVFKQHGVAFAPTQDVD